MLTGIYSRAVALVRERPLVLLAPFLAEMLQHVVEIGLGFYGMAGFRAQDAGIRIGFGLLKVVVLLGTLLLALRYWRFHGDACRARRIGGAALKGLAIVVAVQIGAYAVILPVAFGLGKIFGDPRPFLAACYLLWLFISMLLLPWFTGLLVEDGEMGLRRSASAIRPRWLSAFGLFLGGILPLMILHYAIGYGAKGQPQVLLWMLMAADAALVALLILCIASTYFAIYRIARPGNFSAD